MTVYNSVLEMIGNTPLVDVSDLSPDPAVRILANYRNAYVRLHDHARALLACDALVELTRAPEARRDRGLHALALGAMAAAQADLEAYLEERPTADDVEGVHAALRRCRVGATLN